MEIHALHVGTILDHPKSNVTIFRGHDERVGLALIMFVILGGEHTIVVDTGSAGVDETWRLHGVPLDRPREQEPLAALLRAGVDPLEVNTVINTHLHWDHCANNDLFPNARIIVQTDELRYAADPLPLHRRTYERVPGVDANWLRGFDRMETVTGDTDLFPDIRLIHLPGHSPGSQGVLVACESGNFLIAGDCVSLHANWDGDDHLAHIPTSGSTSMFEAFESFEKIERLACTVIPSHDLEVVARGLFR